jgi:transcriptional regulator with XRE-family HTH domain
MATVEPSSNWYNLSDTAIALQLGAFLRQIRLEQNLTQENLAVKAGLSRSAIYEMENGKSATSLITIVQVLRALERLHLFDAWKDSETGSPIMRVKMPDKKGLRSSSQVVYEKKRDEDEWEWL